MRFTSETSLRSSHHSGRAHLGMLTQVRWGMLLVALLLALVGLATIHSASSELATDYSPRQALWVGLGVLVFIIAFLFDYQLLTSFALTIYVGSLVLLVLVLFIGKEAGGAQSWLGIGSARFQPSEFAKLATALLLARYVASCNRSNLRIDEILVATLIAALPMALVSLQPDLGGAAMFAPMLAGVLLVAGIRWRLLVSAFLLVLALGAGVWNFAMIDYQKERIKTFVSPDRDPLGTGYQLRQSKIAVGSGRFVGRGYKQGTQSQLRFLPARHTDFILAVLAEEWGFLGVVVVLGLYFVYILNGAQVAMRARDRIGVLLTVGLLSVFSFHVLYNSAMVVGLLPITGIPLPFLSYGGSFTLTSFAATGLILGVDFRRHVNA